MLQLGTSRARAKYLNIGSENRTCAAIFYHQNKFIQILAVKFVKRKIPMFLSVTKSLLYGRPAHEYCWKNPRTVL